MLELMNRGTPRQHAETDQRSPHRQEFSELEILRLALDQVDYGLVVVDADSGALQFTNALGRDALDDAPSHMGKVGDDTGLRLECGRVVTRRADDAEQLRRNLLRTRAGFRGLLNLGNAGRSSAVAVVPLNAPRYPGYASPADGAGAAAPACLALLVFAKQHLCDDSTMALFARERGLTSAEGQVLAQVCRGLRPAQIADHHGVQISTVRTQLRSIRMKTCCETIRELVQKVSVLPPMALHLSSRSLAMA